MVSARVDALLLGLGWFDPCRSSGVRPVGNLHDVARNTIKVAGVVTAASAELAPYRQAQGLGEQRSSLELSAVAFGFLGIQCRPPQLTRNQPLIMRLFRCMDAPSWPTGLR